MAKGDQLKSDVYAADRQDQAAQRGAQGAQALGAGLMSGAEAYRSGLAQQFAQQQAVQKMALENAQVNAHVASLEMSRQEASARVMHTQQMIATHTQTQQLRMAKTAADMSELQLKKSQAEMEERGEVPWSDRLAAHITENPIFEDPNSPTGYGYYQQTGGTGSPLGWKPKHAPKDMVERIQTRQRRKETGTMHRDAYTRESMHLDNLLRAPYQDQEAIAAQRERLADVEEQRAAFTEGREPKQRPPPPPTMWKKMAMAIDQIKASATSAQPSTSEDLRATLESGLKGLSPDKQQLTHRAILFIRRMEDQAAKSGEPIDMKGLATLVEMMLRGQTPGQR